MLHEWYYSIDDKPVGPISGADLKRLVLTGKLGENAKAKSPTKTKGTWVSVNRLKGLSPKPKQLENADSEGGKKEFPVVWACVAMTFVGFLMMWLPFDVAKVMGLIPFMLGLTAITTVIVPLYAIKFFFRVSKTIRN